VLEKRDEQMATAMQALALLKHMPADPILRRYVPKKSGLGTEARGAAVWGLGKLHAGRGDHDLVASFSQRLLDYDVLEPEIPIVHRMAAVGLGLMKDPGGRSSLQRILTTGQGDDETNAACNWALAQIKNEKMELLPAIIEHPASLFLEPMERP